MLSPGEIIGAYACASYDAAGDISHQGAIVTAGLSGKDAETPADHVPLIINDG
jgi:hypothetical protein